MKFDKIKDNGVREPFETGSVRDTRKGKGRYDLLPPRAIRRLAEHYEHGADKYTLYLPILNVQDISNMVQLCICEIENPYVTQVKNITQMDCAGHVMRKTLEIVIQNIKNDNIGNPQDGEKGIEKNTLKLKELMLKTLLQEKEKHLGQDTETLLATDLQWMTKLEILEMDAKFVGKPRGERDTSTSTTTTQPEKQGDFYVDDVIKDLECSKIIKTLLEKHSSTCPLHLYNISKLTSNFLSIVASGDHNWELGQPSSRYADSLLRHMFRYMDGERDEDHITAVIWNAMGIIFNEEYKPELDDLTEYSQERAKR